MAANERSPVGISHLTVVPENFDPAAPGSRRRTPEELAGSDDQ